MAFFDSMRRALALALVGAVVFGLPTLLQPVLAPSWGAGPTQIAALLALNLAAGALGASLARVPGGLAFIGATLSLRLPGTGWTDSVQKAAMPPPAVLALSAWSGFQFLHAQTGWTHHFAQIHANSHISFGLVALALLLGLPLGALAAHRLRDLRAVALLALAGGLLLPATQGALASSFARTIGTSGIPWDVVTHSVLVLAPTAALSGLLFPWLLKRLATPHELPSLLAANLLGGMAGAATAGLVSLPLLGLHTALAVPALGWAVVAVLGAPTGRSRWIAGMGAAVLAVATWSLWSAPLSPRPDYEVLDRADGWSGRVEHVRRGDHEYLVYNGNYALGGTRSIRSQSWQAEFALALRPHTRDVYVLGLGTGITAGALARSETLRRARVVELLPQVERLARRHFQAWTGPLFADPRFEILTGDARTTLRDDTARYDLILGDLFLPWLPGAELLMGREHFISVRDHLRADGLFVQWLPLYQLTEPVFNDILATASSVFGDVHLFRENHDPEAPMIALVAAAPGSDIGTADVLPEIVETWTGSTSGMPFLDSIPAWTHSNRLKRGIASGGIYPGQPPAYLALAGSNYVDWVTRVFRARFPDANAPLGSFGPKAWRHAARGFFLLLETASHQRGDDALADIFAARAASLVVDSTAKRSSINSW